MRAWVIVVCCLAGCADVAEPSVGERGLGLAEGVIGSCEDACGEATLEGNCWCDVECVEHGDCCEDKVDTCGGALSDPSVPVLCEVVDDCPAGLTCDQSACYSGCREGDDCEDACLGLCVEPQQQSLPHPTGTDPSQDDDGEDPTNDGDGTGADAGPDDGGDTTPVQPVPECDCPAGDLCVPLCPVCPPEVPEEECQCSAVCVAV